MVALCDLELDRLDVKIAILHSKLERTYLYASGRIYDFKQGAGPCFFALFFCFFVFKFNFLVRLK